MAPNHSQPVRQAQQAAQQQAAQQPVMFYALNALECVIARIAQDGQIIIRPVPRGILRELQHEHGRNIQLMACYCPDGFHGARQCEQCAHQRGDLQCACLECQRFKA